MASLVIYALLIFLCLAGLLGLFFFSDYIKKISSLSIVYSSFVVLITILALKNSHLNEILVIMVSILVVFSVNLLIGIGIVRNIAQSSQKALSQKVEDDAS